MVENSLRIASSSADLFADMNMPAIGHERTTRAAETDTPVKEPVVKPAPPETAPPPAGEPLPAAPGPITSPEQAPETCPDGECDF